MAIKKEAVHQFQLSTRHFLKHNNMQNKALKGLSQNDTVYSSLSLIEPYLGKWYIDSTKLWIPIDQVKIIDDSIFDTKLVVSKSTGNIESEFKTNSSQVHENGIKTKYCYVEMPYKSKYGTYEKRKYIVVLFNSKLLKDRYFEGISSDTIKQVYDELMKHKKVAFTYNNFLDSTLTDTDWKCDVMIMEKGYDNFARFFKNNAKSSSDLGSGYKPKRSKENQGIQFSIRKYASTSKPFFKLYAKTLELRHNSIEFLPTLFGSDYLEKLSQLEGLYRLEFTVKNSNYYESFKLGERSLRAVLNWSQDKVKALSKSIITKHLISEPKVKANQTGNMKPMDKLFIGLLEDMVNRDKSIKRMYQIIDETFNSGEPSDRKAKSNYKKRMKELYSENFEKLETCRISEITQNAADCFGIGDEFLKN